MKPYPILIRFIRYWLPVILWSSIIFLFSSHPTGEAFEIHWQDFFVKKIAHMIEYGILAVLMFRGLKNSGVKLKNAFLLAFSFAVFYGITDEIHQSFTPGREPHIRDVIFDTIGASLSLISIWKILPKAPSKLILLGKKLEII